MLRDVARATPSRPTWISVICLTPLEAHCCASLALIRREALEMSGKREPTPEQNSLKPAPVPVDSMIGVPSRGLARATRGDGLGERIDGRGADRAHLGASLGNARRRHRDERGGAKK